MACMPRQIRKQVTKVASIKPTVAQAVMFVGLHHEPVDGVSPSVGMAIISGLMGVSYQVRGWRSM